jgi:hypothetical protein
MLLRQGVFIGIQISISHGVFVSLRKRWVGVRVRAQFIEEAFKRRVHGLLASDGPVQARDVHKLERPPHVGHLSFHAMWVPPALVHGVKRLTTR